MKKEEGMGIIAIILTIILIIILGILGYRAFKDDAKGKKIEDIKANMIIAEFLSKGLLEEDKLDKYYALSNEDLESMELDIENEKKSYYIINYETNEVYITKGYKEAETEELKYKLEE